MDLSRLRLVVITLVSLFILFVIIATFSFENSSFGLADLATKLSVYTLALAAITQFIFYGLEFFGISRSNKI